MDLKDLTRTISDIASRAQDAINTAQDVANQASELAKTAGKKMKDFEKLSDILKSEKGITDKVSESLGLASSLFSMKTCSSKPVANKPKSQPKPKPVYPVQNHMVTTQPDTSPVLDTIMCSSDAVTAVAALGAEIAKTIQVCQTEETKRTAINARMEVEVTRINAISRLLSDYLDKTFDERAELFDNYFRVLDQAIESGDTALMSATLGSINSLAAQSPFKNLADFASVQQQLTRGDTEWDI